MSIGNKTILLVEDDSIIAFDRQMQLEREGYTVLHSPSGEHAIDTVRKKNGVIGLVLMDVDLGEGLDGQAAARVILDEYDLPLIFLSSHTEREVVEAAERITPHGFVAKDSEIAVLNQSIKKAFRRHEAEIEDGRL